MNRLVSSIVAAACSIIAATAPGGSAPGNRGQGMYATSGIASRSRIPAVRPATTSPSVPSSASRTTSSPAATARHWSSTLSNAVIVASAPASRLLTDGGFHRTRAFGFLAQGDLAQDVVQHSRYHEPDIEREVGAIERGRDRSD